MTRGTNRLNTYSNCFIVFFALDLMTLQVILCSLNNLRKVIFERAEMMNFPYILFNLEEIKETGKEKRVAGTAGKGWEEADFWQNRMC